MQDRWFTEIELQKVFNLSPSESSYVASVQYGLSVEEIAVMFNVSPSTVYTSLSRARNKMKKESKGTMTISIIKGNRDVEGVAVKQRCMEVILMFVSESLGVNFRNGDFIYSISGLDESKPGDVRWMLDNVFRKVYIDNTTNSEESKKKAQKLKEVYDSLDKPADVLGYGIIVYWLQHYYMQFDKWSE